jgi:hypothetical protein
MAALSYIHNVAVAICQRTCSSDRKLAVDHNPGTLTQAASYLLNPSLIR